jgi:hypothetical protein
VLAVEVDGTSADVLVEDVIARQPAVVEDVEQRLHDVLDARAGLPALGEPQPDLSEHAQLGRRDLRGSCSITQTN